MAAIRKNRRRRILAACLLLLVACLAYVMAAPRLMLARLRRACEGGDRMVIDTNARPEKFRRPGEHGDMPTYELQGEETVDALLDTLGFRPMMPGWSCRCFGELLITIYRGDVALASISVHHSDHLRWRDGEWSGDAPLTRSSLERLSLFLKSNGCPTPAEQEAESARKAREMIDRLQSENASTQPGSP